MSASTHSIADTLNGLIKINKDGQEGFRQSSENVEDSSLKTLLSKFSLQRASFAGELQQLVIGLGEKEEDHSGMGGAIHRGWINLKGALTKHSDHAILEECEMGEDFAKGAYEKAVEDEDLPRNIHDVIAAQYAEVKIAHDRIKALRDSTK